MNRLLLVSITFSGILVGGCSSGVTEYVADNNGRLHPIAHYHDYWEQSFEQDIEKEMRGDPPPFKCKSWRQYWEKKYEALSRESWGPKVIAEARTLRKRHGLDPY